MAPERALANKSGKDPSLEKRLVAEIQKLEMDDLLLKDQEMLHSLMIKLYHAVDYEKALKSPKIFQLQKSLGTVVLYKLTILILKNFANTVNVKNSLNSFQMMDLAQAFIQQYTHSSLKDLILCLKMVKYGKLGPIYDRLDVPTVMDFIRKYQEAKSAYLEQKARGYKDAEANEVNQLSYSLPKPIKNKVVNSLPANTINREYKRLKLSIDKKRAKINQEVYRGHQKIKEAPEK